MSRRGWLDEWERGYVVGLVVGVLSASLFARGCDAHAAPRAVTLVTMRGDTLQYPYISVRVRMLKTTTIGVGYKWVFVYRADDKQEPFDPMGWPR